MAVGEERLCRIACQDGLRQAARCWRWPAASEARLTPVLCLPGLSRQSEDFCDLAAALAPRPVIALDLIGRGRSDRAADPARYAPERLLDDIRHTTAALGLHRAVAVGTSFGGLLAMGLAVSQPCLLAGAVLNDVGPEVPADGQEKWLGMVANPYAPADWADAVRYLRANVPDLSLEGPAAWRNFAETTYEPRTDGGPGLSPQWDPRIAEPLAHAAAHGSRFDLWVLFRAAAARPLLAVQGGTSTVLTDDVLAAMHAAAPAMASVTLPGIGHAPTLVEPTALAAVRTLVERVDGAERARIGR